jgi:putative acetyltransferase
MDRTAHEAATVTIRSMEPEDAAAVSALLGTVGTLEGTLQLPDMPVASRIGFLQGVEPRDCRLVAVCGATVVGQAGLHQVQPTLRRAHVRVLGLAVAPAWQGRGIGRQLMDRLLAWADGWAGVLRIELQVHADNDRAMALYRSVGFEQEGRHRAYALRDGRYIDSFTMARLHPAPPRITA